MTDPDIRHGPLEDLQGSLGAKLGPFGGWLMPIEYRGSCPSTARSETASACST